MKDKTRNSDNFLTQLASQRRRSGRCWGESGSSKEGSM